MPKPAPLNSLRAAASRLLLQRKPTFVNGSRVHIWLLALVVFTALALGEKQRHFRKHERRNLCLSHPLITWLIENSCIGGLAVMSAALVPPPTRGSVLSGFRSMMLNTALQVWGTLAIQHVLTYHVYSHVPMFTEPGRPNPTVRNYAKGWRSSNLPMDLVNSLAFGASVASLDPAAFQDLFVRNDFSPMAFLAKLWVGRVCVDAGFWAGHRALHHPRLYWLHRKHHEHHRPSLLTNAHFSPLDLWIEGALPLALAMVVLDALRMPLRRFELSLFAAYFAWHESGSHCGKPLPVITYFPPLAPVYQIALGPVDLGNVKHHDLHHALLNCNYGITIWPDIVMGTRVSSLPHREGVPGTN